MAESWVRSQGWSLTSYLIYMVLQFVSSPNSHVGILTPCDGVRRWVLYVRS